MKTSKQIQTEIAKLQKELSKVRLVEKTNMTQVRTLLARYKKWLLQDPERIEMEWANAIWMAVEK